MIHSSRTEMWSDAEAWTPEEVELSKYRGVGFGGSKTATQPSTTTTTSEVKLPDFVNNQAQTNLAAANNVAQNYKPNYTGELVAGLNGDQQQAFQSIRNMQGQSAGGINTALGLTQQAANYNPMMVTAAQGPNAINAGVQPQDVQTQFTSQQVSTGYQPQQVGTDIAYSNVDAGRGPMMVRAGTVPQTNLSSYMNPYTDSVVNSSMAALERQRQIAVQQAGDAAIKNGAAFGSRMGAREGSADAQTNIAAGQLAAQLYGQNYDQATALAQNDLNRNLTAQQSNASNQLGFNAQRIGAQTSNQQALQNAQALAMQGQTANMQAGLSANAQNLQGQQSNQAADLQRQQLGLQGQLANQSNALGFNAQNINAQNLTANNLLASNQQALTANLANQQAGLAQNQTRLTAGQQTGNLTNLGQQLQSNEIGLLNAAGNQQQAQQQAQDDAAYQQYMQQLSNNSGLTALQIQQQGLASTPYGQTTTGQTTTPVAARNPTMSILGGIGTGAAAGAAFGPWGALAGGVLGGIGGGVQSDARDKTDRQKLGRDPETGLMMEAYRYKSDPKTYPKVVSPMAQEIEKKYPSAVKEIGGHKVVKTQNLGFGGKMRRAA